MDTADQTPNNSPVLFGGTPTTPPPEVFENVRKNHPTWYRLRAEAYELFATRPENAGIYADPKGKGATLEQVWLYFTLYGVHPYCLLARSVPQSQTTKISSMERLIPCTPERLIETLKKIETDDGPVNLSTLHFDGKTGHNIVITSYDKQRDRFIYHDPWPLESLLSLQNNMAGVDAQPEGERWSVTSEELERVVFASMVLPPQWARFQGVNFDLMFSAWKESEFFKFFHLKQVAERSENGMNRRMFDVGPFKESISLIVDSTDDGKIVKASLILNKDWMVKNPVLALDLEKSFMASFAPPPDHEAYSEISSALWSLRSPKSTQATKAKIRNQSQAIQFLDAFMGAAPSASMRTDFGDLSLENITHGQDQIQELVFTLF